LTTLYGGLRMFNFPPIPIVGCPVCTTRDMKPVSFEAFATTTRKRLTYRCEPCGFDASFLLEGKKTEKDKDAVVFGPNAFL
jgi:hypothetical protein